MIKALENFYIEDKKYCYPNTKVLKNKLNIKDFNVLNKCERKLVSLRIVEMLEQPIKGNFDFAHLKNIHRLLFQDVYEWAGDIRTCTISKMDLFCLPEYINNYANNIFEKLKMKSYFINYNYNEKIVSLVKLFADINALHPFREGNGRVQREFIEELSKINGVDLNITSVDKKIMDLACHESVNKNYDRLFEMFFSNSKKLSIDEQLNYINMYCSKSLVKILLNNMKQESISRIK